jgi:hypothetical protein
MWIGRGSQGKHTEFWYRNFHLEDKEADGIYDNINTDLREKL